MSNIVHQVWKILDNNPDIKRNMKQGLINTSALARHLIQQKKIDATMDAVISAIRRYEIDKHDDIFTNAYKLLGQTINVSTKSNLAEVALTKDDEVQKILPKLFEIIQYIRGDILRVMQANESLRLLIDEKNYENVVELFPKNKILNSEKNLAEINIYIHPKMQKTPGILSTIANELAINEINIVEFMTCPPEMLIILNKNDLSRASEIFYQLCDSKK